MPFQQVGGLRYYTFDSLSAAGVLHGIFTRRGGVSPAPWHSLNLGSLVGDDLACVAENRRRAAIALGRDPASVADVWQVHGCEVVCAIAPRPLETPPQKADVLLTDRSQLTLLMRFADCTPILLYDPRQRVVGMVHAGWQGTVQRAAAAAVDAMQSHYACHPEDILAAIGPSIGVDHYPVGEQVIEAAQRAFGRQASALFQDSHFDLWAANRLVLEESGVRQIEIAALCTACHPEDWYSHRGEAGRTGRFAALIALQG